MRTVEVINDGWLFRKGPFKKETPPSMFGGKWETVNLPHTWNNLDGQDGSGYLRTKSWYAKTLRLSPAPDEDVYLQFDGVSLVSEVYLNGNLAARHTGGFSAFRVLVTPHIRRGKVFVMVSADNRDSCDVYPRTADFTFFGGMYRGVSLITVKKRHFDLDNRGGVGVHVTTSVNKDGSADVTVKANCTLATGSDNVRFTLDGKTQSAPHYKPQTVFHIENPHLWDGVNDPFLYTVKAELCCAEVVLDEVSVRFGIRSFRVDPQKGFILNGRPYPLHGVSRHQDRENMGWAITKKEHAEDMELIKEIGANTIRLAHYQHSQDFYDLCDENGMIVWAEIPFISEFSLSSRARANTVVQMKELIEQNFNHPSIVCWGIANEITIAGESEELLDNLRQLNKLCHTADPTRLTTMANLTMVEIDSKLNRLTDILSYNHYFGWYMGTVEDNGPWIDEFHQKNPDIALGISEYGAEGIIRYHTDTPQMQDYTEEYQAYYHEKMLETFAARPFLWSTHVWNMFDFASDMRDEGGVKGRNNKGLVTYNRKIRKDAFYIYKAWWSKEPFVHICSSRYVDRPSDKITVKVYSNQPSVTLYVDEKEFATVEADKVFVFDNVPVSDSGTAVKAVSGQSVDTATFRHTDKPNPDYSVPISENNGKNWFDGIDDEEEVVIPPDCFGFDDKIGDLMKTAEGEKFVNEVIAMATEKLNINVSKGMMNMVKGFTIGKVFEMAGSRLPKGTKTWVAKRLSEIKKP